MPIGNTPYSSHNKYKFILYKEYNPIYEVNINHPIISGQDVEITIMEEFQNPFSLLGNEDIHLDQEEE